jgi:hypothetical protein
VSSPKRTYFDYHGDAAGSHGTFDFEIEDMELEGTSYCLRGTGSEKNLTVLEAEVWDAADEAWVSVDLATLPVTCLAAVSCEQDNANERAWERYLESCYG